MVGTTITLVNYLRFCRYMSQIPTQSYNEFDNVAVYLMFCTIRNSVTSETHVICDIHIGLSKKILHMLKQSAMLLSYVLRISM